MTDSILKLATSRKTARKFSSAPVPMEAVIGALEAARQAPSGANRQPWRFILVDDPELKGRIRRASERGEREMYEKVTGEFREWLLSHGLSQRKPFLEEAPLLVVVLMDRSAPYAKESVWVAIGFILLALEESGLSTLPYTPSNTKYPLDELDAPPEYALEAILPIGYSEDKKQKEPKLSLDEIVHRNKWGDRLVHPRP